MKDTGVYGFSGLCPMALVGWKDQNKTRWSVSGVCALEYGDQTFHVYFQDSSEFLRHAHSGTGFSLALIESVDIVKKSQNKIPEKDLVHHENIPAYEALSDVLFLRVANIEAADKATLIKATLIHRLRGKKKHINPLFQSDDGFYYKLSRHAGIPGTAKKNQPYTYAFKLKLCRLKAEGVAYKDLAQSYGVYHETIKDWYALYKTFGKEGLTKKKAKELAKTKVSEEDKRRLARAIMNGEKTYRKVCLEENVSLSRLHNWVKKERRR